MKSICSTRILDRIAIFSLRAVQALDESKRYTPEPATYLQVSFGLGYINIARDFVTIIRCLLVNATYGSERYPESSAASSKGGLLTPPPEGTPDLPKVRFWVRRFATLLFLAFVGAMVPGIVANSYYSKVFDNQKQVDKTAKMRCVHCFDSSFFCSVFDGRQFLFRRMISSAVILALTVFCIGVCLWSKIKLPRVHKRPVLILTQLFILLVSASYLYVCL